MRKFAEKVKVKGRGGGGGGGGERLQQSGKGFHGLSKLFETIRYLRESR